MKRVSEAQKAKANEVSAFIQQELARRKQSQTTPIEAAKWLQAAGLLRDSKSKPGLPLRRLLRAKLIGGQEQLINRRWFINRIV